MKSKIIAGIFITFIATTSIFMFIIATFIKLSTMLFDKRLVILQQFTCFWGAMYSWLLPLWRVKISGKENIKKKKYMIVSNHLSQLDILIAFRLFSHFKFVSKTEIFNVPFIGWNMTYNKYIKLKRGDKESIAQMMADSEKSIDEGNSIYFFPEGSRSPDGEIKKFKHGAFEITKRKQIPILPIVISGTNNALPKYKMQTNGVYQIRLKVLPEIPYKDFKDKSIEETAEYTRSIIAKEYEKLRKETDIK